MIKSIEEMNKGYLKREEIDLALEMLKQSMGSRGTVKIKLTYPDGSSEIVDAKTMFEMTDEFDFLGHLPGKLVSEITSYTGTGIASIEPSTGKYLRYFPKGDKNSGCMIFPKGRFEYM